MSDADENPNRPVIVSADDIMCNCSGTTRCDIQGLFAQGMDMMAISRYTGALTGCGGCEWDIAQFINELYRQQRGVA